MSAVSQTLWLTEVLASTNEDEIKNTWLDFVGGRPNGGPGLYDLLADELYGLALWTTGSADDACDVVQTVFLKLLERRPALGRVRHPRSYILRMTRSASIDVLRRRRPTIDVAEVEIPILASDPARRVDARRISQLLIRLPPNQRATVYLRLFSDLSFRQIGVITGAPTFTAASRFRLALQRLRTWVERPKR